MKRWQFWLGALVSGVFLFFALRSVDLPSAWQAALSARHRDLLLAWLCLLVSYVVRAWRWRIILYAIKPTSLWTLWRVYMVGLVSNNILPVRMGEIVRAYIMGQMIDTDAASFEQARLRARVNRMAYLHADSPDYSAKIRQ